MIEVHDGRTTRWAFFFFNDTATTEIYTLSLHDALPISEDSLTDNTPPTTMGVGIEQEHTSNGVKQVPNVPEIGRAHV